MLFYSGKSIKPHLLGNVWILSAFPEDVENIQLPNVYFKREREKNLSPVFESSNVAWS